MCIVECNGVDVDYRGACINEPLALPSSRPPPTSSQPATQQEPDAVVLQNPYKNNDSTLAISDAPASDDESPLAEALLPEALKPKAAGLPPANNSKTVKGEHNCFKNCCLKCWVADEFLLLTNTSILYAGVLTQSSTMQPVVLLERHSIITYACEMLTALHYHECHRRPYPAGVSQLNLFMCPPLLAGSRFHLLLAVALNHFLLGLGSGIVFRP